MPDRVSVGSPGNERPAVCPNGHAMDEGLFNCPACGAYRPSASTVASSPRTTAEREYERQQRLLRWYRT